MISLPADFAAAFADALLILLPFMIAAFFAFAASADIFRCHAAAFISPFDIFSR